jgi:hypothetical protein
VSRRRTSDDALGGDGFAVRRSVQVELGLPTQEVWIPQTHRPEAEAEAEVDVGGVPGRIWYDDVKPAVPQALKVRDLIESERFTALRSHYGFDSFFCRLVDV